MTLVQIMWVIAILSVWTLVEQKAGGWRSRHQAKAASRIAEGFSRPCHICGEATGPMGCPSCLDAFAEIVREHRGLK